MNRTILRRLAAAIICLALFPALLIFADDDAGGALPEPDPEGVITFENLDSRLLTGGLAGRIMMENLGAVSGTDFENLREYLRLSMNSIAEAQWMMVQMAPYTGGLGSAYDGLSSTYDMLRQQFDDINDGTAQKDAADRIRMVENLRDTVVMGGEALYIGVSSVAAARGQVQRQMDALDRALTGLELRHRLGQISDLTLEQQYANRAALASALETMGAAISTYIMHLEEMVGAPATGTSVLGALPEVTAEQLDAMDLEADLAAAKAASYALYAAELDLEDARENWKDAREYQYEGNRLHFRYIQAEHAWQAAQLTYENEIRQYERRFRVLYLQVKDDAQIVAAKEAALETELWNRKVAELKYRLGTISYQELLTAGDALSEAQDAADSAKRTLFSAWNSYRWAVDRGILGETDYVSMGGTNA